MRAAVAGGRPTARIVFDGQSHNIIPATAAAAYPARSATGLRVPWVVVGIGGQSWTTLLTTAATRTHVYGPLADTAVLVLTGGTSDILEGDTAATVMSDLVAYADAARVAGFDQVIATTIPPGNLFDSAENTQRSAFNDLVVADAGGDFDAVADFRVPELEDNTDLEYYMIDLTHWTPNGAQAAANVLRPLLVGVLP